MSIVQKSELESAKYISVFSASRITGYSRRMLRYLIGTGELPAVRSGKRMWKIKPFDLYDCFFRRMHQDKLRKEIAILDFVELVPNKVTNCGENNFLNLTALANSTIYSTEIQNKGCGPQLTRKKGDQHAPNHQPTEVYV